MGTVNTNVEADGRYIVSFIESASNVSPVFERQIRDLSEEYFDDLDPEKWYPIDSYTGFYDAVAETVGEKTIKKAGKANIKAVPWPEDVDSVQSGLKALNEIHRDATRGGDEQFPIGRYTVEIEEKRTVRFGISQEFPFPTAWARGAMIGIIEDLGPENTLIELEETVSEPYENGAWNVSW